MLLLGGNGAFNFLSKKFLNIEVIVMMKNESRQFDDLVTVLDVLYFKQ